MPTISRRDFLSRALTAAGALVAAPLLEACTPARTPSYARTPEPHASPTAPAPTAPAPTLPADETVLKGVADVSRIAKLLGEGAINDTPAKYGLHGADLGSMFDRDSVVYMVFGDSFGCCIPGTGGPGSASDWRSNTMALISDRDPTEGLTFDGMITDRPGHAAELLAPGPGDVTVIPTHGVAVGERIFLHTMAVRSWGDPGEWTLNGSGLAYSDDDGRTWTRHEGVRWTGASNFGQAAIVAWEGDLYFFGILGGRFGGVKLARVGHDAILDLGRYRYFAGLSDGAAQWTADEEAAVLVVPPPVGELSVMRNPYLDRWTMTYLDERRAATTIREAPALWGPWSAAMPLVSGRAYPGLYGAYMHPWYVEGSGEVIYFAMSQWGPYSVFWMRARLVKR